MHPLSSIIFSSKHFVTFTKCRMRETMKYNSSVGILFFVTILAIAALSYSSSPRENTIPIISMKTGIDATSQDINMNVICNLLWHNFDGIWISGWLENYLHTPVLLCDSAGAYVVLSPSRLQTISYEFPTLWQGTAFTVCKVTMHTYTQTETMRILSTALMQYS